MRSFFAFSLLATLAIAGDRASAQANVTENQSTYNYVDAQFGSDANSGAQSSPFNIGNYKTTSAPLTLQAAVAGTAIIAGSDVLTGWSNSGGIYTRGWPYAQSACTAPAGWPATIAPIALRTEMIFVNGTPLTQVLSWSDMTPGTFFINYAYAVIHINPPTGTEMSTAVVEAAVRSQTLSNRAQDLWFDTDNKNISISNTTLSGNVQAALQIERNEGPGTLQNSILCSSAAPAPTYTDFTINLDSNNYTMAAGKAVATIRVNSFGYGPVGIKAEGMPAGVSVSSTKATLTSGVVTLTFSSNSTAVAQTVPITLFGTSGSRVHSATFYLNVTPL